MGGVRAGDLLGGWGLGLLGGWVLIAAGDTAGPFNDIQRESALDIERKVALELAQTEEKLLQLVFVFLYISTEVYHLNWFEWFFLGAI